jgi:hypothetical protein
MSVDGEVLKISLGGREFVLYDFPWRLLKKYLIDIREITKIDFGNFEEGDLDKIAGIMFQAVSIPNQEGTSKPITREEFEELPISLKQMMSAIPSLLKQAGMEPVKPGEAPAESPSASTS